LKSSAKNLVQNNLLLHSVKLSTLFVAYYSNFEAKYSGGTELNNKPGAPTPATFVVAKLL